MTTTSIFSIINLVLFIITSFIFLKYFTTSFLIDYFDNKPRRWIPERDRFIIALGITSIIIGVLLFNPNNNTWNNIFITIIKLLSIFFLILSIKNRGRYLESMIYNPIEKTINTNKALDVTTPSFKLSFKNEDEVISITKEYIKINKIDCTILDIKNMIEGTSKKPMLNWIDNDTRSKNISLISLFNYLDEICITDISNLIKEDRRLFRQFIIKNFIKGGEVIDEDSLNSSYSRWKSKSSS